MNKSNEQKTHTRKDSTKQPQQWLENSQFTQQMDQTQQQVLQKHLIRDCSFQSDDSHCSSVESVLELRKPDPTEVLLELGFGPNQTNTGKIPARFLKQSKLIPQIDINTFLERYYGETCQSVPSSPARITPKTF